MIGFAAVAVVATAALAADDTIPAKVGIVKPDKLTKFVSKNKAGFPLPTGAAEDPTTHGAQISFFDTLGVGGSFTHELDKSGWVGLGKPPGAKDYKYEGKKAFFAYTARSQSRAAFQGLSRRILPFGIRAADKKFS